MNVRWMRRYTSEPPPDPELDDAITAIDPAVLLKALYLELSVADVIERLEANLSNLHPQYPGSSN